MAINRRKRQKLVSFIQPSVERLLSKRSNVVLLILFAAVRFSLSISMKPSAAQDTASVPKPQNKLALGEDDVKQLMLVIGPNKDGKTPDTLERWRGRRDSNSRPLP